MNIVSLSFLADILSDTYSDIRLYGHCMQGFRGVRVLRNDTLHLSQDYCYICDPDYITTSVDPAFQYILCGKDDGRFTGSEHMVIPGDTRVYALCDLVQDHFDRVQCWTDSIHQAVTRGAGVQQLLELSGDLFGHCPMIVTSPSLMILGYVQNDGAGASSQLRSIIFGKDYLQLVPGSSHLAGMKTKTHQSAYIEETTLDNVDYRVLRNNLYSREGSLLGRLSVCQDNSVLRRYHIPLSAWLSEQLGAVLTQSMLDRIPQDHVAQELLVNALRAGISDEKAIRQICLLNQWRRENSFQIVSFSMDEIRLQNNEMLSNLDFAFGYIFPNSRAVVVDQTLALVLSSAKENMAGFFNSWLRDYVKQNRLSCGCSDVVEGFRNIDLLFHQSVFAMQQASQGGICYYSDVFAEDVLSHFAADYGSSSVLLRSVKRLMLYDSEHNAELSRTLLYYLLCDRSHEKCSKLLNIHRSTLRYRLGQIRDVGGIVLEELTPRNKLNLLLSLAAACGTDTAKPAELLSDL